MNNFSVIKSDLILPTLAEDFLKEAKHYYQEHKKFSPKVLERLTFIYGEVLVDALDIVDKYLYTEYITKDESRIVYFIPIQHHRFFFTEGVNYCSCSFFTKNVVTLKSLTCSHVLGLILAKIVGRIRKEVIKDGQLSTLLDNYVNEML